VRTSTYTGEDATKYGVPLVNRNKVVKEAAKILEPGGFLVWFDMVLPYVSEGRVRVCRSDRNFPIDQPPVPSDDAVQEAWMIAEGVYQFTGIVGEIGIPGLRYILDVKGRISPEIPTKAVLQAVRANVADYLREHRSSFDVLEPADLGMAVCERFGFSYVKVQDHTGLAVEVYRGDVPS
jgi:hypothetical protein